MTGRRKSSAPSAGAFSTPSASRRGSPRSPPSLYDDAQSAAARLRRAGTLLRELAAYDTELGAPAEALGEAEAYLEDAIGRARALRDRAPFDPERLGRDRRRASMPSGS